MLDFCESAKKHFRFLETEYNYKLRSSNNEEWGGEVVYGNDITGIKIRYEFAYAFIFIFVYKLVDGEMVENPWPMERNSIITCFDFNDALPEGEKMKPAYEYGPELAYHDDENGISNYVYDFSARLKKYGNDVLTGDFSILPDMEKIIKRRIFTEQ